MIDDSDFVYDLPEEDAGWWEQADRENNAALLSTIYPRIQQFYLDYGPNIDEDYPVPKQLLEVYDYKTVVALDQKGRMVRFEYFYEYYHGTRDEPPSEDVDVIASLIGEDEDED